MTFRRRPLTPVVAMVVATTFSVAACGEKTQEQQPPATVPQAPPSTVPAPQAQAPQVQAPTPQDAPAPFSEEQLHELVAPVALYPDVVLASLFPATTFPDQIAEAATWLRSQGGQADEVPQDRGWDGSVAGLLQFPDVLYWLDENDDWTDQVATAITYQQSETLDAVQDFRREVKAAGNLESNQYQKVEVQDTPPAPPDGGPAPQPIINIQPAQPDTVYVPQYNPTQVVQAAPATAYPAGYPAYPAVSPWMSFGTGMLVGGLGAWAMYEIFDDDDWDGDHWYGGGGGGGHNQTIKINGDVNIGNERPGGGYRPNHGPNRPSQWNPNYRPRNPGNRPGAGGGGINRPTQYPGTKPRPPGYAGVRPPQRPGMDRPPSPVATTRPAPRPAGGRTGGERPTTRPADAPGGGKRPVAKPSAPPQLARDAGARGQASRGQASLQGKKPSPAPRPAASQRPQQPKRSAPRQPEVVRQPPARQPQARQQQARPQQQPAMRRQPAPATRQYSQRGNSSMGGGGRGGGGGGRGGGGGGRGGGGGGRGGRR